MFPKRPASADCRANDESRPRLQRNLKLGRRWCGEGRVQQCQLRGSPRADDSGVDRQGGIPIGIHSNSTDDLRHDETCGGTVGACRVEAAPCVGISPGSWWQSAVDFLYPATCAVCQQSLRTGSGLCHRCLKNLDAGFTDFCRRCCAPVGPHLDTTAGCYHCLDDRFAFQRAYAFGVHDGPLRAACLQMKQDGSDRVARALTDLLLRTWGDELRSLAVDIIVPVPAHWSTRMLRIAHPAQAIAERIGQFLKAPVDLHILRKPRRTPAQASLSPTRRRENLRGAFHLARGVRLHDVKVLLVDDVLTTGTTANRAARVLMNGDATAVHVAVISRGIGQW
ncbi:MAG: double zinc ribbon domain-containing protein [Planctomycetaceae bacterium]